MMPFVQLEGELAAQNISLAQLRSPKSEDRATIHITVTVRDPEDLYVFQVVLHLPSTDYCT